MGELHFQKGVQISKCAISRCVLSAFGSPTWTSSNSPVISAIFHVAEDDPGKKCTLKKSPVAELLRFSWWRTTHIRMVKRGVRSSVLHTKCYLTKLLADPLTHLRRMSQLRFDALELPGSEKLFHWYPIHDIYYFSAIANWKSWDCWLIDD